MRFSAKGLERFRRPRHGPFSPFARDRVTSGRFAMSDQRDRRPRALSSTGWARARAREDQGAVPAIAAFPRKAGSRDHKRVSMYMVGAFLRGGYVTVPRCWPRKVSPRVFPRPPFLPSLPPPLDSSVSYLLPSTRSLLHCLLVTAFRSASLRAPLRDSLSLRSLSLSLCSPSPSPSPRPTFSDPFPVPFVPRICAGLFETSSVLTLSYTGGIIVVGCSL